MSSLLLPTTTPGAKRRKGDPEPQLLVLPEAFKDIFKPCQIKTYYGGRGSAKSWTVGQALILLAVTKKLRIVCAREFQNSITDSVHRLLSDIIERMGFQRYFVITQNSIKSVFGSEFMFKGLRHNPDAIKSLEGADICWVEEAQHVSQDSWDKLLPTIRKAGSEVWITFNPDAETDPTYQEFVVNADPDWIVQKVNYTENKFFPEELRKLMERSKRNDFEAYLHIWEGHPKTVSDAIIFKGKFVCEGFETPDDAVLYFGADWGFSDPATCVRCFVKDDILYIDHEAYGVGVEVTDLVALISSVPGATKWPIRADSSGALMISHCQKNGLPLMQAAKKPGGSIEDGINWMRGLEKIVIHPRCKHTYEEFKLYSKKIDRLGTVIPDKIVDKHNHCIDAIRYALQPEITKKHTIKTVRVTGF
jgi:phage terminase large subunit